MAITSLIQGGAGSFLTLKNQSHQSPVRPLSAAKSIKFNSSNKNQCSTLRLISNGSRNQFQFQLNAAPMGRVGGMWYEYSCVIRTDTPNHSLKDRELGEVGGLILYFVLSSYFAIACWGNNFLGSIITIVVLAAYFIILGKKSCFTSAIKLQVCLLDKGGGLQMDLNRIAETANTSDAQGRRYVISETIVALLRRQNYFISSNASVVREFGTRRAQTYLNKVSINERLNFEETLVNVNNMKSRRSPNQGSASESHNEQITVTLLLVPQMGRHFEIPSKLEKNDFVATLKELLSFSQHAIREVEVLWTPQFSLTAAT